MMVSHLRTGVSRVICIGIDNFFYSVRKVMETVAETISFAD